MPPPLSRSAAARSGRQIPSGGGPRGLEERSSPMSQDTSPSRRAFLKRGSLASLGLVLRYSPVSLAEVLKAPAPAYKRWEDVMRNKWTWDRVVHGTHGTNCAGTCALNVYVKNGVVWREEQPRHPTGFPRDRLSPHRSVPAREDRRPGRGQMMRRAGGPRGTYT